MVSSKEKTDLIEYAGLEFPNREIYEALAAVHDPEIPVLSILDMGVVRTVTVEQNLVIVDITPTYSGCPAMDTIADDVKKSLENAGFTAEVKLVLAPAWNTAWITERGRQRLREYGIAPPLSEEFDKKALLNGDRILPCPQCHSKNTKLISQFGSTACKALFQCNDCLEPFEYFKCLK